MLGVVVIVAYCKVVYKVALQHLHRLRSGLVPGRPLSPNKSSCLGRSKNAVPAAHILIRKVIPSLDGELIRRDER